jgi:CheY-like chemotaxis protein
MKILAVDDDPIILELLGQFVEIIGAHELTTAPSALHAIDMLGDPNLGPIDCFMLDIQMPSMDGIELAQHIRNSARHADTPILMLTAMSDKRYIDAAFAVRGGMSNEEALKAITLNPARTLRVDDRLGSLEKGKDADLLILSGHPLDYRSFVLKAFINGKLYYDREKSRIYREIPLTGDK